MKPTVPLIPPTPLSTLCRIVALTLTLAALTAPTIAGAAQCPNETLRTGPSAALPDCRAYEQVSPTNKGGFSAYRNNAPPARVSSSGEAIAYLNGNSFPGAVGSSALFSAHVGTRTAAGWQNAEWNPPIPKTENLKLFKVDYSFSADLSQAVLAIPQVPLTPEATPWVQNLFHRDQAGSYSLVNTAPPAVPIEAICEPEELPFCWQGNDISAFVGAPSDFDRVYFESNSQLTPEAPGTGIQSLYESSGGVVRLVGFLPDGVAAGNSTAGAGGRATYSTGGQEGDRSIERAVSTDGSRVIFQAPADGGEPDEAQAGLTEVYDRLGGAETVELSAPATGATPAVTLPESATFQSASVDGSRVFFTSSAELTTSSNTGSANQGEDLYEYDFARPAGERLLDLTVDSTDANGAEVLGVVDTSADGSYVYFVAGGQLEAGKGAAGQPNLYMIHAGGAPIFITSLSASDSSVWTPFPPIRQAYVTPNGQHIAFTSTMSLPTANFPGGYDNSDKFTGQPDIEVFEYTAPTGGEPGRLVCGSCDPTGAHPIGDALIGGISPNETHGTLGVSTPLYRVRALSEDGGRLFYAAPASPPSPYSRLLEFAHNRVYEYEQAGHGSCAIAAGCQELISSPASSEIDRFLGASADGSDVYFATTSQLLASDTDSLVDVYDARVDGGFPSDQTSRCQSGCRSPATEPSSQPPLATSSSGPSGNLAPPSSGPAPPKTPTRAQLLSRALKACHAKHNRRRRHVCEAHAHKRYGPRASRSSSHTTSHRRHGQ